MSNRPEPPSSPENAADLAAHVSSHADEWLMYFRNINACLSETESALQNSSIENQSLRTDHDSLRELVSSKNGVISYPQEENVRINTQLIEANARLIEVSKEEDRALDMATPAVQTPASPPKSTQPAKGGADPSTGAPCLLLPHLPSLSTSVSASLTPTIGRQGTSTVAS